MEIRSANQSDIPGILPMIANAMANDATRRLLENCGFRASTIELLIELKHEC